MQLQIQVYTHPYGKRNSNGQTSDEGNQDDCRRVRRKRQRKRKRLCEVEKPLGEAMYKRYIPSRAFYWSMLKSSEVVGKPQSCSPRRKHRVDFLRNVRRAGHTPPSFDHVLFWTILWPDFLILPITNELELVQSSISERSTRLKIQNRTTRMEAA